MAIVIKRLNNTALVSGRAFQTGNYITAVQDGLNVLIREVSSGRKLVFADYTEFEDENGSAIGGSAAAVVSTLNSYFSVDNPDGIINNRDTIRALDGVEQFTTAKVGQILIVGDTKDGSVAVSNYTTNAFYKSGDDINVGDVTATTISTSGIGSGITVGSGGTISSVGAITTSSFLRADSLYLEGATDDLYETHLVAEDPTQDNTITFPNTTGTVALTSDIPSDLTDLGDTPSTLGSAGQVLAVASGGTTTEWVDQSGGGSDSFNTITVSGQNDVVADSGNDTLTLVAGSNLVITTDDTADSVTFALSSTPSVTSLAVGSSGIVSVGNISTLGSLTATGNLSAGNGTFTGNATFQGSLQAGTAVLTGIEFTGGGTTSIGIATGLPNQPTDLQITSNGNVTVLLDADTDETGQKFAVHDPSGTERFGVDDTGVVSINDAYSFPNADGTANQVLSTDGSGSVSWVAQSGDADIGQLYKTSSQVLTNTFTAITAWDGEDYDDLSVLDGTGGTLTITQAGKYLIQADVHVNCSSGANRSDSEIYLDLGGTEVSGTRRGLYHRLSGEGQDSATISYIYKHTSGTATFKIMVARDSGSDDLFVETALFNYATLGGATGAQGVSGDAFEVAGETASRTLVAGDHLKYLRSTSASAVTFTVPPQSSVSWVDNAEIVFEQAGVGQITIAAGSGVTINSSETLKSGQQYAVIGLKRVASDTWTLTGEREVAP